MAHNEGVSTSNNRPKKSTSRSNILLGHDAVEIARAALVELDDGVVGEHIGVQGLSRNVATHRFAAEVPGYPGWEWNAVLACASGSDHVTVNEVALIPTPSGEALQAPEWVPYSDRLLPGDLGPGDLMPPAPDDERLTEDEDDPDAVFVEISETRDSYLTRTGLKAAETRWRTGEHGPNSEYAEKAQLRCRSCAFYLPLGEPVGENFGVCTNKYSADGIVVHGTYGCGAHSETVAVDPMTGGDPGDAFDDERPIFG